MPILGSTFPLDEDRLRGLVRQLSHTAAVVDQVGDPDGRVWLSWAERQSRRRHREREARKRLRELRDVLAGMSLE